jgi:hypothetical protein
VVRTVQLHDNQLIWATQGVRGHSAPFIALVGGTNPTKALTGAHKKRIGSAGETVTAQAPVLENCMGVSLPAGLFPVAPNRASAHLKGRGCYRFIMWFGQVMFSMLVLASESKSFFIFTA